MKRKSIFTLSLLLVTLAFTSCEKSVYDADKQPQKEKTVADLVVPSGFDWKMVKNAQCEITAQGASNVSVYSDQECTENVMLATLQTNDGTLTIPLSLPANSKEAYLQYETVNGKKMVLAAAADKDNVIHFTLPQDSKPSPETRADNANGGSGSINYPKNGWGTVMFEDMFPSLGDYDFNDFVLGYRVQIPFRSGRRGKSVIDEAIQFGIELRAMGGSFPYAPCVRLKDLKAADVDEIEVYQRFNTSVETVVWSAGPDGEVIMDFRNLVAATSKPSGSTFFNTDKEYLVTELPQLNIAIYMNKEVNVNSVDFESFDFYLAKADHGPEIHLGGYKPVYDTYPSDNSGLGWDYYYNKKGLIWGLNVPAPMAHVIEKGNFLDAYKDFAAWAMSGGQDKAYWYNGEKNNELLIKAQ